MKIGSCTPLIFKNNQIKSNKNVTGLKLRSPLAMDTVSFGERSFDNKDPNTQLYRGVGSTEIKALCNGETLGGTYYATSSPRGYRGGDIWSSVGGYGKYFIAFKKNKVEFRDHRDYDSDTRYLVDNYNLADVKSIRKGQNEHGELIYSTDFENDKKKDVLAKQKDIKKTLISLKNENLTPEEKRIYIKNLESYSSEFPDLHDAIKIANKPLGSKFLKIEEKYLTPSGTSNEDKDLIEQVRTMTAKKVEEFGAIRDIKNKIFIIDSKIKENADDYFKILFTEKERLALANELKVDMAKAETRLKTLLKLENKNNVINFEIKSLQEVFERYQKSLLH
jgi:hypothetical protein